MPVTFNPGYRFVRAERLPENADGTAAGLRFSLPWYDPDTERDFIADALIASAGGDVAHYVGFLDEDGEIIADPVCDWAGVLGRPVIEESRRDAEGRRVITVSVEAREGGEELDRSTRYRMTHPSQAEFDNEDVALAGLANIRSLTWKWGPLFYSREP